MIALFKVCLQCNVVSFGVCFVRIRRHSFLDNEKIVDYEKIMEMMYMLASILVYVLCILVFCPTDVLALSSFSFPVTLVLL